MLITRSSLFSGKVTTREIDILPESLQLWQEGLALIQEVAPHLTASDREFIISGVSDEEWEEVMIEEND